MRAPTPQTVSRRLRAVARGTRDRRRARSFRTALSFRFDAPPLLLSPHLDDAVLDCWRLLAGAGELRVVNVFAGVPSAGRLAPWDAITGAADSAERVRERIVEDERALALAGRRAEYLGFLDAQYRSPGGAPSVRALDRALAAYVADGVARVYAPAGIGAHPDHLLVRRYACLLAGRGVPVSLYAELPYCVRHGWPPWVDGREPDRLRDVDAFWSEQLAGVAGLPELRAARVVRLTDREADAKLAAMRCYATQLPALDFAAAGALCDRRVFGFEVGWELHGPRSN
jgi:LmbE family N-acetylglucosaminyl deacetylase